jgi:rare lipoprotein A
MPLPVRSLATACLQLVGVMLLASACSRSDSGPPASLERRSSVPASTRVIAFGQPIPKGGGTYKVGEPYQIDGQWHRPQEDPDYDRVGIASYYAADFHGRRTSNGEIFDMWALSAAHPTLPLPSHVYVTNLENGRTLGFETRGTARVRVRYAGRAPLTGDDRAEQRFLASQPWFKVALSNPPQ